MSAIADRYRRLSADLTATIRAVPNDRWDSPTPCTDWDALGLVRHLTGAQGMFLGFVSRAVPAAPSVEEDALGAWGAVRDAVQAALDDPAVATTTFEGYAGPTTFETSVERFLSFDLLIHRWDLAQATGLDTTLDPADVDWAQATADGYGEMVRMPQVCGPAVEVGADADPQTRLLAYLGRRA